MRIYNVYILNHKNSSVVWPHIQYGINTDPELPKTLRNEQEARDWCEEQGRTVDFVDNQ